MARGTSRTGVRGAAQERRTGRERIAMLTHGCAKHRSSNKRGLGLRPHGPRRVTTLQRTRGAGLHAALNLRQLAVAQTARFAILVRQLFSWSSWCEDVSRAHCHHPPQPPCLLPGFHHSYFECTFYDSHDYEIRGQIGTCWLQVQRVFNSTIQADT